MCPREVFCTREHSSFIYNGPELDTSQTSIHSSTDKPSAARGEIGPEMERSEPSIQTSRRDLRMIRPPREKSHRQRVPTVWSHLDQVSENADPSVGTGRWLRTGWGQRGGRRATFRGDRRVHRPRMCRNSSHRTSQSRPPYCPSHLSTAVQKKCRSSRTNGSTGRDEEEGSVRVVDFSFLSLFAGRGGRGLPGRGFRRATHPRSGRRHRGKGRLGWLSTGLAR